MSGGLCLGKEVHPVVVAGLKMRSIRSQIAFPILALLLMRPTGPAAGGGDGDDGDGLEERTALAGEFQEQVRPFLQEFCVECHGSDNPKAKFSLVPFDRIESVASGSGAWNEVVERLRHREMPPEEATHFPGESVIESVLRWDARFRRNEARRRDGDPGVVLARRLSNAEYNYAVEDLTGVDIRPTREFPIDAANQAGFDNSGESLSVTSGLFTKYLQAARSVAEHVVFTPTGLSWSPHPVVTETDRDKFAVLRIVEFYRNQPTDLADYFHAAWTHLHQDAPGSLNQTAAREGVSASYLQEIWSLLRAPAESLGPVRMLQDRFAAFPPPGDGSDIRKRCEQLRDEVLEIRRRIEPAVRNLEGGGVHRGSQTYVLWKNRQYSNYRFRYDPATLMTADEIERRIVESQEARKEARKEGRRKRDQVALFQPPPDDLILPDDPEEQAVIHRGFSRFARAIPDRFYVAERGRDYLGKAREKQEKGRLLSAGFHSMMGYYRDDRPLYRLILTDRDRVELDRLWEELDFVTKAPRRQYIGFLWFERTDSRFMTDEIFDFARAEYDDATSQPKIRRLARVYREKAEREGAGQEALGAIETYFEGVAERIRWLERAEANAVGFHLQEVQRFAARAYGRSLGASERDDLLAFYRFLRDQRELSHEDAIRDSLVGILVSPYFFLRVLEGSGGAEAIEPLTDVSLANRLSAFLWSSLPDEELSIVASQGGLREPGHLLQQVRRMLRDGRSRRLAVEFGANWLDFRRFENHNAVDRGRFPEFDNGLRSAMFEEPIRFLTDLIRNDGNLGTLLYGKHTFVNGPLARHYGFQGLSSGRGEREWFRFERASEYGRGGLLPMGVFLTMNAPGRRTSPVKRGYWVARRLLGESIPPPPPDVPELPEDEEGLGGMTLSETLARHREHSSCAGCHDRFDSFGLVFEGFGPVGERRTVDMGNRQVITQARFPDGSLGEGVGGLRDYIRAHREKDFYEYFCRQLLSYALGRSLVLSDDPLIERMLVKLETSNYSFRSVVESIVLSRQFQTKRRETNEGGTDDGPRPE